MADRTKPVSGTLSLSEIEREIRFEESKSFEFLTSSIENDKDNLAGFKRLELPNIPKDLKLTFDGESGPNGYKPFPNGPIPMIVGGSKKDVKAWRQQ